MAERVERVAARGVERDRDALAGAFLVERPEIAMRDVLAAVETVARDNEVALAVLLRQALAVDRLVIDGMAVGIDDDHAVFHGADLPERTGDGEDNPAGPGQQCARASDHRVKNSGTRR